MESPWFEKKCVLCCSSKKLTVEHIIPKSVGGILSCRFLCKECNNKMGSVVEKDAKFSTIVRFAAERMAAKAPDLTNKIRDKQKYIAKNNSGGKITGEIRAGQFYIDGSMSGVTLKKRTPNWPFSFEQNNLPGKQNRLEIAPDFKHDIDINLLLPLKIAYEFMASCAGNVIYSDSPDLTEARKMLLTNLFNPGNIKIEQLHAHKYRPFHGICFEGNSPHAIIQIRLFDWIAYRVHFLHTAFKCKSIAYTHHLNSGKEELAEF